jgi:aminomethyltransferase
MAPTRLRQPAPRNLEMKKTPFHDIHHRLQARMVDFAGFSMPVLYRDITTEHQAVRQRAGLFDLSHMGRVRFTGPDAVRLATIVQTQGVSDMPVGRTRYALLCQADGTTLDDILISREEGGFLLVINAGNRDADLEFFRTHARGLDVTITDDSERLAMLAVQGPLARQIVATFGLKDADQIRYYRFATLPHTLGPILVSRTGYTGEDGFELLFDAGRAQEAWDALIVAGESAGMIPCGLGARDTLRLEAGMPLYGHELDRTTNPYEANLDFAVSETSPSLAAAALAEIRKRGPARRIVGLVTEGPRIPRQGYRVLSDGAEVGEIRSGTLSPTLGKNIATARLAAPAAAGGALSVDIRGNRVTATRTKLPFYVRNDRS